MIDISCISGFVHINGHTYRGNSISVVNGVVSIDGKAVDDAALQQSKSVSIIVHGDVGSINASSGPVDVRGNVKQSVQTTNGDIKINGYVEGNVTTVNGSVACGRVNGSVNTVNGRVHRT